MNLSSGYQAILRVFCEIVFFCDVMQVNNWERGLVVIDELDEYLSPRYSAEILNYLQNQFPDMNFLVSTHSLDLVKSTKNMNLIVIGESDYEVYTGQQLEDSMLAEDVFTNLFFEERKIHKSEDDSIDKELRRLLNIKIAKLWNEEYQKEFDILPFDPESQRYIKSLRSSLSRKSTFATFKRNYVRKHIIDYPDLEDFLL